MPKIIHNPRELMNLNRDDLDELLLEEYKNSALLRELIRVCLIQLKSQTNDTEFFRNKQSDTVDKLEKVKEEVNKIIDKYKYN